MVSLWQLYVVGSLLICLSPLLWPSILAISSVFRLLEPIAIAFQVNNGVLYFPDYFEDIYIMVLSVIVSIFNPNHTLCIYHYTTINNHP